MTKTILIVEDEETQARTMQLLLESEGYDTIITKNAQECLTALQKTKPDLIISDVIMPDTYGTDLLKQVRKNQELKSIPFIMATIVSPLAGIEEDIKGIDPTVGFIEKPYTKKQLLDKVKTHLK